MGDSFGEWLEVNTKLSDNSIGKYTREIRTVTKDIIVKSLST